MWLVAKWNRQSDQNLSLCSKFPEPYNRLIVPFVGFDTCHEQLMKKHQNNTTTPARGVHSQQAPELISYLRLILRKKEHSCHVLGGDLCLL